MIHGNERFMATTETHTNQTYCAIQKVGQQRWNVRLPLKRFPEIEQKMCTTVLKVGLAHGFKSSKKLTSSVSEQELNLNCTFQFATLV